jgi:hypothetical protein
LCFIIRLVIFLDAGQGTILLRAGALRRLRRSSRHPPTLPMIEYMVFVQTDHLSS